MIIPFHPTKPGRWTSSQHRSKEFLEADNQRLVGDTKREADNQEVKEMRDENELPLKNRVLKKLAGRDVYTIGCICLTERWL